MFQLFLHAMTIPPFRKLAFVARPVLLRGDEVQMFHVRTYLPFVVNFVVCFGLRIFAWRDGPV